MAVTIGLFILAIGLLFLSRLFIKPPNQGGLSADDQPTTLASRGAMLPYIIGEYETEPVFAWADDQGRFSRQESVGGSSGGKGKGGSSGSETIWFSRGLHAFMPMTALKAIHENGKQVWPPEGQPGITRELYPSGSLINAGTVGSFVIMWGDVDQPLDPDLADGMGVFSRWPGICLVIWKPKRLGTSKAWPQLSYLFERVLLCVDTINDPYILDDNHGARGVNATHALLQVLTGGFPDGLGFEAEEADRTSFEEASGVCIDEHLAVNILIKDGDTADKVVQSLLTDIGAMLVDHPDGMLMLNIVRPGVGTFPVLTDDIVMPPDLEITINTVEKDYDRVIYTFKDEDFAYRDNDIKFDNDGRQEDTRRYKEVTIALYSPTDVTVATTIANRRIQEPFGDDGNLKAQALRGAVLLLPGMGFSIEGVGPLRVFSKTVDTFTAACTIECVLDSLAVPADVLLIDQGNAEAGNTTELPAQYDLATTFLEVPLPQSAGTCRIVALRIRAHNQISGAFIWVSADGASYVEVDSQNTAATGGTIESDFPITEADIVEDGPIIEVLGPDVGTVRDLTSDPSGWSSGSQMMVINGEAFYLRNLTAISEIDWTPDTIFGDGDSIIPSVLFTGLRYVCTHGGNSGPTEPAWPTVPGSTVVDNGIVWEARGFRYETHGLIRARYGTQKADHDAGDVAFICNAAALTLMHTPIMLPGISLCMKTQPFTSSFTTDISGAIAVCKDLTGLGMNDSFWFADNSYLTDNTGDRLLFKG